MTKICPLMHRSKVIDDQPVSAYHPCIENSCEWYDDENQQCAIKSIVKAIDNIDNTDYSNTIDNILVALDDINSSINSVDTSVESLGQSIGDVETAINNVEGAIDNLDR